MLIVSICCVDYVAMFLATVCCTVCMILLVNDQNCLLVQMLCRAEVFQMSSGMKNLLPSLFTFSALWEVYFSVSLLIQVQVIAKAWSKCIIGFIRMGMQLRHYKEHSRPKAECGFLVTTPQLSID